MTAIPEELRERLLTDTPFWGRNCATIIDKAGQPVRLNGKTAQLRFDRALEEQRAAGRPMRAIVLKARKLGFSTWVQAKIMQRITQLPYRRALVVAQDHGTAGELFAIGERIYDHLPSTEELALKPPRSSRRRGRYLHFGQPARSLQVQGLVGLDSSLSVDTAREVAAGRGYTYTELHCSEVAFWPDVSKLTALLNAVPDEPETMIVLESTANGSNHFKSRWQRAVSGESEYVPIFAAWHEDQDNSLPFRNAEEREAFVETIGEGPWGEDEPRLVDQFGCAPEQLHWRRRAIVDKTESKLELFKQEYPASPEEAFMSSGRHVFSMVLVSRVIDQAEQTDPERISPDNPGPELGLLEPGRTIRRKLRSGVIDVPAEPEWTPKARSGQGEGRPVWRIWKHPEEGGRYVTAIDPAEGDETESGETAYHAIQVIDHRTREQMAEYRSRIDPDLVGDEAYLAALYYNRALLVPETTGGYGGFMARRIWRDYGYPLVYRRRSLEKTRERQEERLGWDTSRVSKQFLEDHAKQLLREETHGIRSRLLANEFTTYVVLNERGRTGPEPDAFSDLLMAWMIAQFVAHERPVPREKAATTSSTGRKVRDPVTGW